MSGNLFESETESRLKWTLIRTGAGTAAPRLCNRCGDGTGCPDGCDITPACVDLMRSTATALEAISRLYGQTPDRYGWSAHELRYEANYLEKTKQ